MRLPKKLNLLEQRGMAKKPDKIIIDTNLWISFLITKDLKKLDERIKKRSVRIFFSLDSIDEFLTVADRPKFKKHYSKTDQKDNFLLSLSKDSQANYLITGDKDLLDLKTFEDTKIITMSDYLKKIN